MHECFAAVFYGWYIAIQDKKKGKDKDDKKDAASNNTWL